MWIWRIRQCIQCIRCSLTLRSILVKESSKESVFRTLHFKRKLEGAMLCFDISYTYKLFSDSTSINLRVTGGIELFLAAGFSVVDDSTPPEPYLVFDTTTEQNEFRLRCWLWSFLNICYFYSLISCTINPYARTYRIICLSYSLLFTLRNTPTLHHTLPLQILSPNVARYLLRCTVCRFFGN